MSVGGPAGDLGMSMYRKKAVVQAFQWFARDRLRWMGGGGQCRRIRSLGLNGAGKEYYGLLLPQGGQITLDDGDWVVEGEDYPIKPNIFELTYESVEEEATT